jgi:hypothetical protein
VQLSALQDLITPFLPLGDAQAMNEEYEPGTEQILQDIRDYDEYLLLRCWYIPTLLC